jgi:hypothetical protein
MEEDFSPLVNTFTKRYLSAEHRNKWSNTSALPYDFVTHRDRILFYFKEIWKE